MEGIAAPVRAGRLSLAFLEAAPYRRWAVRSTRTYRQVSRDTGIPLDVLGGILESMGFARMAPDEPVREDELEIVPLLELARSMGTLDQVGIGRIGRAWAEAMRVAATVENQDYTARFARMLEGGTDRWTAMEQVARLATDFLPLVDRAFMACYRRQQELVWVEDLVEDVEDELERAGVLVRLERVPAMCFLDLAGYTRLTEERGDAAAAALAETLAVLVDGVARERGGVPVKRLGDGVKGGDYFGRTVNLAARIAGHAGPGQVLVSQSVADAAPPQGVAFVEAGEVELKGFARPVRLLEARRA